MGKKTNDVETCDYSSFKPIPVMLLDSEKIQLVDEYYNIIKELREKSLTAKDIHELYYDKEAKKYTVTIKTIYRYIEKLEKAGLIKESGYRITKGTRLCEKLYSRTAQIFHSKYIEGESDWWNKQDGKDWSLKISKTLSVIFDKADIDHEAFYELFKIFAESQNKTIMEILEKAQDSMKIEEVYSKMPIEKVNKLNYYVSIIAAFLKNPSLAEKFLELLK